jgi:diadenosine tetraphosphate (Ap4A) HIT family hydrolase
MPCPFCEFDPNRVVASTDQAIALPDGFPVAPGHTLVVPRRHVPSLFDLSPDERASVGRLVAEIRDDLQREFSPDGFNIGLNDGEAAGQTVVASI